MNRDKYHELYDATNYLKSIVDSIDEPIDDPELSMYSKTYRPKFGWGPKSTRVIATLDTHLIYLCNGLADVYNVAAIWGYRDEETQTRMFNEKVGLPWPTSNHNVYPSRAVDIVPYPTEYSDIPALDMMLGAAEAIAVRGGFEIRLGKYFSNVKDYAHIELV